MMADLREADRVLHVASLLAARDRAQTALEDALERARQAAGAVGEAERAEGEAAKPAQEAYALHHRAAQDEEAARRLGKGPAAEAEALDKLAARATVLARYQAPLQAATAAQQEAEALAAAAAAGVQAAEEARDRAVREHERVGYVPLSGETVNIPAQPMVRLALGVDLDGTELGPVDRFMAALPGMAISEVAGITDSERNKARIAERKTIEAEEAKRPRVVNAITALAPGSARLPNGGVYSPGSRP
jgi:hypothetical protein